MYGMPPMEAVTAPSSTPPAVDKQGADPADMSLLDQLKGLQALFPKHPQEQLIAILSSMHAEKSHPAPSNNPTAHQINQPRGEDSQATPVQPSRASLITPEFATPAQASTARTVIPLNSANPTMGAIPAQSFTPTPSAPPQEPTAVETRLEQLQQQFDQLLASSQGKRKTDPFDLLPTVKIPPNCRLDYPKYNGTGDPARHLRVFRSYTRDHAHDKYLLAYLFQFALEGEPEDWYHGLPPENLKDFAIIQDLFLEKYQHCTSYIPTITDLVKEKMKPDEDLATFVQRWRALAARSSCVLSEQEQIQMIVQNALSHIHSWINITGCPTTFTQLYQRGTEVQSALKDPTFQLYASKSKPSRKDQGPTTEGVTINEQISLVNQRSNFNQQAARSNPQKQNLNQVPPPNNYVPRRGGRRTEYPPLPEKLSDIFKVLLAYHSVQLPKPYENPPAHWDRTKYCHFHRGPGHNTDQCFHFRDLVYDMNDKGLIVWAEVRKALENAQ